MDFSKLKKEFIDMMTKPLDEKNQVEPPPWPITNEELTQKYFDVMVAYKAYGYDVSFKKITEEKPKVWILIIDSSTRREILGVYSSQEKAYQKYQKFLEHFSGSSNYSGVLIIERELE